MYEGGRNSVGWGCEAGAWLEVGAYVSLYGVGVWGGGFLGVGGVSGFFLGGEEA